MLGNDVVDLLDADSQPESFRPRFDTRVFTPEERRAISRDREPMARRWAHWAAKEAAFKLVKQIDSGFVFSPGQLAVDFEPLPADAGRETSRFGVVRLRGASSGLPTVVEVRSFETEEWVHVIAIPVGGDWGAVDSAVETFDADATDSSTAARELAMMEISRSLGIARRRLSIGVTGAGPTGWRGGPPRTLPNRSLSSRVPMVELDGEETSLSLSLSHHGRFVSFAMAPRIEPAHQSKPRRESSPRLANAGAFRT